MAHLIASASAIAVNAAMRASPINIHVIAGRKNGFVVGVVHGVLYRIFQRHFYKLLF
jgi:predicted transcriptional regulator of viral defense system